MKFHWNPLRPDLADLLSMVGGGGGDTASGQGAAAGLVGSDDEEKEDLSDGDEEENQVTLVIWPLFITSTAQHTSWDRVVILAIFYLKIRILGFYL